VVPAQPNSKILVPGFGIYQHKVETGERVRFWFQDRSSNLAVVAHPDGGVILDFDQLEVYFEFCRVCPEIAQSYTETTPRGGRHIFLRSTTHLPPGLVLVPGIEIKQLVLVYPSKVGGKFYRVANAGDILRIDLLGALQPFLKGGGINANPPLKVSKLGRPVPKKDYKKLAGGIIQELKSTWSILNYLEYFEPELVLVGHGRFLSGHCPFHQDAHASLWVDSSRNTWGCHGCGAHGDILNWHALHIQAGDIGTAVRDLMRYRVEVRG
jgi:hypothetical protein